MAGAAGNADKKLIVAILMSFAGVLFPLQPSVGKDQLAGGLTGLISGMFTALAYVEVRQLGQLGEPASSTVSSSRLLRRRPGGLRPGLDAVFRTHRAHPAWRGPADRAIGVPGHARGQSRR
ncbi:hypothetical protein ACTMU2_32705 [Cupriavidus basilensis]